VADPKSPLPTFEAALTELEQVVKDLEGGDLSLERALQLFERGMELSDICRKMLDDAEQRVEVLSKRGDQVVPQPFDLPKP
jgi:exodeoxyribonuclease VII small subunit